MKVLIYVSSQEFLRPKCRRVFTKYCFFFWRCIKLLSLLNAADTPKGREDYILTTEEMQMNDYPLPEDDDNHADYKSTHNDGM